MRTPADVRAAYRYLADTAPAIDQLHLHAARPTARSPRRTWLAVAGAAVAAAIVAIVVAVQGGAGHDSLQPATSPVVTCTATSGDPTAAQRDRPIIESRLAALGRSASVSSVANGTGLRIAFTSRVPVDPAAVCTNAVLQVRPVIAATHGPCPRSGTHATTVICAPNDVRLTLGPTIFDDADITAAVPQSPDPNAGATRWTIALRLNANGQRAWSAYTTTHNLGTHAQPTADVTACAPNRVPCGDYTAFIIDGKVATVPLTLAPITGESTQLDAGEQAPTAHNLAARLNPLPIPMETRDTTSK